MEPFLKALGFISVAQYENIASNISKNAEIIKNENPTLSENELIKKIFLNIYTPIEIVAPTGTCEEVKELADAVADSDWWIGMSGCAMGAGGCGYFGGIWDALGCGAICAYNVDSRWASQRNLNSIV